MKSDLQIQKDVMEELQWQPFLDASQIGVAVKNGIVSLSGNVDSYYNKLAAEKAAQKIAGVRAIAEDIRVSGSSTSTKTDAEIAAAVLESLKWHSAIQEDKIKIKVEDGVVRLEGEVEWEFERSSVKSAIEHILGVKSILNLISLKPTVSPSGIREKINDAFQRQASVDAGQIQVEVSGGKVTLNGNVRSYAEKLDAENVAWNAPGVTSVDNKLNIVTPQYKIEN